MDKFNWGKFWKSGLVWVLVWAFVAFAGSSVHLFGLDFWSLNNLWIGVLAFVVGGIIRHVKRG